MREESASSTRATKAISAICRECGRPFVVDEAEQAFLEDVAARAGGTWYVPKRCTACRAERRRARFVVVDDGQDEQRTCTRCGMEFTFEAGEKAYYAARAYHPPKTCPLCRSGAGRR